MSQSASRPRRSALVIQLLFVVGALGLMAAAPPAVGRILIVPLGSAPAGHMLAVAIDRGARLVGPGRLPGSYVIEGNRAALAPALLVEGVALLAAPAAGCGA